MSMPVSYGTTSNKISTMLGDWKEWQGNIIEEPLSNGKEQIRHLNVWSN